MNSTDSSAASSRISDHLPEQSQQASRPTALEIFAAAARTGEDDLKRSTTGLAISGLAAGLEMGLTGLGSAVLAHAVGVGTPLGQLLVALLYPVGFIVVVLGRSQLFTENTLFPVILVLDRRRHFANMLRLWGVVFVANIVGTGVFAVLISHTPAVSSGVSNAVAELGARAVEGSFGEIFWAGVTGGWIIALMAWLVTASRTMMGQLMLVYLLTFVVGAAHLAHCIAGSAEALSGVLQGVISPGDYLLWLLAATVGNTLGGVLMVSMLNYGQIVGSGQDATKAQQQLDDIEDRSRRARPLP